MHAGPVVPDLPIDSEAAPEPEPAPAPDPEPIAIAIEPCWCGERAEVYGRGDKCHYVKCDDELCWRGPVCKSQRDALDGWNSVMLRVKQE
jgi:hypothetical protein